MTTDTGGAAPLRPFYFTVVFWGLTHRNYFRDLLLASLLAPGNIPALDPERKSKFVICTTADDWAALQDEPLFVELQRHVTPFLIEMQPPGPEDHKMRVMSAGHKLIAEMCHRDKAYGLWLSPDVIFGDGAVRRLEQLVEQGNRVVLSVAIRFEGAGLTDELTKAGVMRAGQPLTMAPRALMAAALKHIHSETRRYEFRAPWFADSPVSVYWWLPDKSGFVIYTFSWCPLVIDYDFIVDHDTSTFDEWTLDGDYLHRNLEDSKDVYICTDSDEIAFVSLTTEAELHFDLVPEPLKGEGVMAFFNKLNLIQRLWASAVMDPLKRDIFDTPVFFHSGPLSRSSLKFSNKTRRIILAATGKATPPASARTGVFMLRVMNSTSQLLGECAKVVGRGRVVYTGLRSTALWYLHNRHFVWHLALWKAGLAENRPEPWDSPVWNTTKRSNRLG